MARKQLRSIASRPAKVNSIETLDLAALPPDQLVVHLPENACSSRNLNFGRYYGHGCDVVVYATQRTLERMTNACVKSGGKTRSASTIAKYYSSGLSAFLPFCATVASVLGRDLRLDDIDRQLVDHFVAYLQQLAVSISTKRGRYTSAKTVLVAMGQSGWVAKDIFPCNPFPYSNRARKGETAFSEPERRSVLKALKSDMLAIIDGCGPLTSEELVICLLAIAARTGINPTPARELLTDCLQPHPIKADRYVLVSFKRRGNNTHIHSLRRTSDIESMAVALPDVARIIDLVRERNAVIRQASDFPELLFVFESRSNSSTSKMCRMSVSNLKDNIVKFLDRHQLSNADGKPLRFNFMRLRKTFENRLFTLSGQDPFLTAKLGGHSLKVSNDHYLEAPEDAKRNWRLMGEVRVDELLNHSNVSRFPTENTPVARCRDTLDGELAPKNGEHCQKFLGCFRCRSFVVTSDDLYRVFSLYWMLVRMRQSMGVSAWKRIYGHIIRIIDREIVPKFDTELVAIHRLRAKIDPHPFWRDPYLLEGSA